MTTPQGNPYAQQPQPNPYGQQPQPYAQQGGCPQPNGYAAPTAGYPQGSQAYPDPAAPAGQWAAPQGQGSYPAPQAPVMCRFCGGSPAVRVTFRAHRGLLVLMTFRKLDGPMCATCGLGIYRTLTTETLWQGWWSPFSLFLFTPFTLIYNVVAVGTVKKLQAPAPGSHGQQFDPGVPIHRRPLAYVAVIPVLWVLFLIVTGLTAGS